MSRTSKDKRTPELNGLPDELLCKIFERPELEQADLRNVVFTSRKLNRIAAPIYYRHCLVDSDDPLDSYLRLRQYLATISSRPDLGRSVHELVVGPWKTGHPPGFKIAPLTDCEASNIVRAVPWLTSSALFNEVMCRLRQNPTHDAMTLVILCLLPKLQTLSLDMKHFLFGQEVEKLPGDPKVSLMDFNSKLLFRFLSESTRPAAVQTNFLTHLTSMFLRRGSFHGNVSLGDYWDVRLVSLFIKLPCLEYFDVEGCRQPGADSPWECPVDGSNVKEIWLHDSILGPASIRNILRSCRALRVFGLERPSDDFLENEPECGYSFDGINEELNKHSASLERLRIFTEFSEFGHGIESAWIWEHEPLSSLKDLQSLTFLEIDEVALFGAFHYDDVDLKDILPDSLERVHYDIQSVLSQKPLFRNIGSWLLSKATPCSVTLIAAKIKDMESVSAEMPGVVFENNGDLNVVLRKREPLPPVADAGLPSG